MRLQVGRQRKEILQLQRAGIRLITAEHKLPNTEIKWIGRLKHQDMVSFVKRHNVSWDWLLCGDLRGRLRMARARRGGNFG
jgi:hypothetical protein